MNINFGHIDLLCVAFSMLFLFSTLMLVLKTKTITPKDLMKREGFKGNEEVYQQINTMIVLLDNGHEGLVNT